MGFLTHFVTDILILLWIFFCLCIKQNPLPNFNIEFLRRNCVNLAITHFKSGWNFLFRRSIFQNPKPDNVEEELKIRYFEGKRGSEGAVECTVCLSEIEEGDEIRELRCDHLFHRICLDKWIGLKHLTCPLCRTSLAPPRTDPVAGPELLFFNFCSSRSSERMSWGLR